MGPTIKKYIVSYGLSVLLFIVALILERSLEFWGLSLWLLSYLVFRRVSFKAIFLLGLVADLTAPRLIGVTGIFLSILLIFFIPIVFRRRLIFWFFCVAGIGLLTIWSRQILSVPMGFLLTSILFLPLFMRGVKSYA